MKQLIVNADDFGLTRGHNTAILRAHKEGIVTSASLLANGSAFDDAVDHLCTAPNLSVGVHLTLLEGQPVSAPDQLPDLVGSDAKLETNVYRALIHLAARPAMLAQVETEWRAQVARVAAAHVTPSHLDSHKHLHVLPPLISPLIRVASEFGIKAVRLPLEWPLFGVCKHPRRLGIWLMVTGLAWLARPRLRSAGLRFPDRLIGLLHSGQWTASELLAALQRLRPGVTELMTHPGQFDADTASLVSQGYTWVETYAFEHETESLCDPAVRTALQRHGIQKTNFWNLNQTSKGNSGETSSTV